MNTTSIYNLYRKAVFCTKLFQRCSMTPEAAERVLSAFYWKDKPCFRQENNLTPQVDLMIVLPVYNVEAYLEQCLKSLFSQKTSYSYSIVAIDDGSTDGSARILTKYEGCQNLRVIRQENRGRSGARNRALKEITGRYVMFVDPDDDLPEGAVEALMSVADQYDADVVGGGYSVFSEKGTIRVERFCTEIRQVAASEMHGFNCMKVMKSERLEHFCFPDGFEFEDTVWSKLVFPACERLYMAPDIVYHYRIHEKNISTTLQNRKDCLDTYWITKYCLEESNHRGMVHDSAEYRLYLHQCWVNYLRTRHLSEEIKLNLFSATRKLLMCCFSDAAADLRGKERLLHQALKCGSYEAYNYLMDHWEIM